MTSPIVLSEYEERLVDLGPADAEFIQTRLGGRIAVGRTLRGGGYLLNPRQHVGVATLPSGLRLECRPKVPARNLFLLLALAYDLPDPFLDLPAELGQVDDVLAFAAARFATLLEDQLDRGLYRAYIDAEENLTMVRGRIAVAEDIRRNAILRHRTYCRYGDYDWDVPENRVLRQVVRLLATWGFPGSLRRRLAILDAALAEIMPGRLVAADLDRFVYGRLTAAYQSLHRLCRLFLDVSSPSEASGSFPFDAYFIDMNRLFEAVVARVLADRAPSGVDVAAQRTLHLDRAGVVPIRPDVLLRRGGRAALVLDSKYKRLEHGEHRNADLYQMVAYCTALGIDRGMLVYPRHLATVAATVAIQHSAMRILESSLDLSLAPPAFAAACDALAAQALDLATG